jgi:galactokinase
MDEREMIDAAEFSNEFSKRFGGKPAVFSAPGRVNLIGEHTDYNEGFVLPFAIDKRTYVGIAPRTDGMVRAHTRTLKKSVQFALSDPVPGNVDWSTYLRGVITVLAGKGIETNGADILIDSNVPFGAGLSSSAALEIALGMAISEAAATAIDPRELAFASQQVEHRFAGVRSGIMDQFASALGESGSALLIDCRSLEVKPVHLRLEDTILVICDSRVKHSLASSEYNRRREECEEGVKLLGSHMKGVNSLRDITAADFESLAHELPDVIRRRCRHVISENARTLAAAAALERGDLLETGRLMVLSHQSLRDDYEVSCPELDLLVETATAMPGVSGARMTGGGFGGCTINLLQKSAYEEFEDAINAAYRATFNQEPHISIVVPSEGARQELL